MLAELVVAVSEAAVAALSGCVRAARVSRTVERAGTWWAAEAASGDCARTAVESAEGSEVEAGAAEEAAVEAAWSDREQAGASPADRAHHAALLSGAEDGCRGEEWGASQD